MLTTKLNNGTKVLAKLCKGELSAVGYVNRTQAQKKAVELAKAGHDVDVCRGLGRPFYVRVNPVLEQRFCEVCGGLKSLKADGESVPPQKWMQYGMASDIGCVCREAESAATEDRLAAVGFFGR